VSFSLDPSFRDIRDLERLLRSIDTHLAFLRLVRSNSELGEILLNTLFDNGIPPHHRSDYIDAEISAYQRIRDKVEQSKLKL
jgi:hypothetical protein